MGILGLSERKEEPFSSLPELDSPSGVRVRVMLGQCSSRRGWRQLCGQEAGHSELPQRVVSRKEQWLWAALGLGREQAGWGSTLCLHFNWPKATKNERTGQQNYLSVHPPF